MPLSPFQDYGFNIIRDLTKYLKSSFPIYIMSSIQSEKHSNYVPYLQLYKATLERKKFAQKFCVALNAWYKIPPSTFRLWGPGSGEEHCKTLSITLKLPSIVLKLEIITDIGIKNVFSMNANFQRSISMVRPQGAWER